MEEKIIELYLSGYGSTTISKILTIPKRRVLKILNKEGLIRERNNDYSGYNLKNGKWFHYYVCKQCNDKVECFASEKYLLHRNLKNKNICKKCSLFNQEGEGNPFYGKSHKNKSKVKISHSRKGKGIGNDNAMSKKQWRDKVSIKLKEKWLSGDMELIRKENSDRMKKRHENGEIKSFNRSKAEDEIIKILENEKIECIPNFRITSKIYDIMIPSLNLIIEYNGDYWHCNPKKYDKNYFNQKKNMTAKEIWEYDEKKLHLVEKNNYNYEIVWESDYKSNPNIIKEIIKNYERKNK